MVRVLVRAWRTAVRTCRRFAGSFNSGKARSIAIISARSCLSVTSAPSRANSRSRSAPSSIVLAIRTPVTAAHRCIRRRSTLQRPISSIQRCPGTPTPALCGPLRTCSIPCDSKGCRVRWHSSIQVRQMVSVFASASVGSPSRREAISSGPARTRSARARHNAACHARATGPPLRPAEPPSHPPTGRVRGVPQGGEGTTTSRVPRRIRKWRTPTRPPRT